MSLSEIPRQVLNPQPVDRGSIPGQIVLVMQGGGAPGVYQAGVYQALHDAGIEPDWVVGTSIGAINGVLIAGNPTERRVERLQEFWTYLANQWIEPWNQLAPLVHGRAGLLLSQPRACPRSRSQSRDRAGCIVLCRAAEEVVAGPRRFRPGEFRGGRALPLAWSRCVAGRCAISIPRTGKSLLSMCSARALSRLRFQRYGSMENIIGTAASTRTRRSKWSSTTILAEAPWYSRCRFGIRTDWSPNPSRMSLCGKRTSYSAAGRRATSRGKPKFIGCVTWCVNCTHASGGTEGHA